MGFGKDGKGFILWDKAEISVGALASDDAISTIVETNLVEDFRILKTEWFFAWRAPDFTEGPILVGMAAGGLSAAEIEETIESVPSQMADVPPAERSMRPVWPLAVMMLQTDGTVGDPHTLKQGEFNPRWTMPNPLGWSWWIYNHGNAALTAGGVFHIVAKHFGVWVI